jgi:dTMP kinase
MADKLSPKQVEEVSHALQCLRGCDASDALGKLTSSLKDSTQSAFSSEALQSIDAAIAALEQPLEQKPTWTAAKDRGLFFVFEGLDRSGKSTQSKLLTSKLEKLAPVKWMCFPNRSTAVGTLIDLYLRNMIELPDETVHQLFSANRWESALSIVETLNEGTCVICDRYAFSGVAYSAAKGLDLSWCQAPDVGLPVPDGVFFLHVDEKVGASRANFGDERYENATMQSRVREEFRQPAIRAGVEWHDVDAAREIQVIHEEIVAAVEAIKQAEQENPVRPIQKLWLL